VAGSESGGVSVTPEFGWPLIEPTDFVTNLPADFETFADAVDASLYALNPGTTAGDLDYYTSATAKARLGIGTAGQVLVVNSGATAPEWGSASAPAANFTLLNSGNTTLSGTGTKTISGISGINDLLIVAQFASSASASSELRVQFNTDTGTNYNFNSLSTMKTAAYDVADTIFTSSGTSQTNITLAAMGNSAGDVFSGGIRLSGCNSAGVKVGTFTGGGSGTNAKGRAGVCWYEGTSAISSVSIISSTGNFDGGSVFIYGA